MLWEEKDIRNYFKENPEIDEFWACDLDECATNARALADTIAESMDESVYDEMLDECYPVVRVGCAEFSPSYVLCECDPIAYRCGFSDFCDAEAESIEDELTRIPSGDCGDVRGYDVEYYHRDDYADVCELCGDTENVEEWADGRLLCEDCREEAEENEDAFRENEENTFFAEPWTETDKRRELLPPQ